MTSEHKYNTRSKSKSIPLKKYEKFSDDPLSESDNSSDNFIDDEDNKYDEDNKKSEFSKKEYHIFLANLFPSKYSKKKIKSFQELKPYNKLNKKHKKSLSFNKNNLPQEFSSEDNYSEDNYSEDYCSEDNHSENNYSEDNDELKFEIINKYKNLANKLLKQKEKNPKINKLINKQTNKQTNKQMKKKENKKRLKNLNKFNDLLYNKGCIDDEIYFSKKLDIPSQKLVIKKLKKLNQYFDIEKPYLLTLLERNIPDKFKAIALKKINTLKEMSNDFSSSEYNKLKTWIDSFIRIPFDKYNSLPLTINDGINKTDEYITNSKKILDDCVYGLEDAKLQILQLLGQWLVNPSSSCSAIAIHGPMGTGKTSLIKNGISKILNRPFELIALGGATDASFLEGHSYTYEGSNYGKIIDILIQHKTMNPIIMFDELDKVSDSPRGEEIIGILTHLTDTTQNSEFHDKYFSEIDFNLSNCLFVFSYNDETKINSILKDRLYKIKTTGYNKEDKINISKNYLLPGIFNIIKINSSEVIFSNLILEYIINNYTFNEKGVRNLKRCLEIILTKINLLRLIKDDNILLNKHLNLKLQFPFYLTEEIIQKLLIKEEESGPPFGMYL